MSAITTRVEAVREQGSLTALRSRVAALVAEEATLIQQAFELSRQGDAPDRVERLFARVQVLQAERNRVKAQIGQVLGGQRLHLCSEVWQPGVYDYRKRSDAPAVRVRVAVGPSGLTVSMPGSPRAVSIDALEGSFEGPWGTDDPAPEAGLGG